MKREHLLIAAAWVATVIVAYFVGSSLESSKSQAANTASQQHGAAGAGASGASSEVHEQRAFVRKFGEFGDENNAAGGKANVKLLIARARQQFASGMGGMMNIRGMLKAIAPLAELDDSQLQEALAEVEQTTKEPQQRMMFYSLLLGQWAEKDGKAALAYADEKLGNANPMDMGIRASIIGSWSRQDPDGVWRWFQTERKDDGNDRNKSMLMSMMFAGMAANDLDTALQRASTLDDSGRAMAMQGITGSVTSDTARQRMLDRAQTLPPDQRQQIRQGIMSQWAMTDPDAAIAYIHSLPVDDQKSVRDSAANMMLMMQPAKAADLMLENVEDKDKPQIYDRVVQQWAWQDQKAAGEWLSKQPQGPELDNARRTYAVAVAQKDPAAAMDWAKSVQNPDQHDQAVEQIYQQWRMKDPTAADASLDTSGLPNDKIKQLKSSPAPSVPKVGGATAIRTF